VWVPALRLTSLWFRPRVEVFDLDDRWWTMEDPGYTWFSIFYAGLNVLLVAAAVWGACKFRTITGWPMMVFFVLIRTAFLSGIESVEPRYVLECYPVLFIFAAALFKSKKIDPAESNAAS